MDIINDAVAHNTMPVISYKVPDQATLANGGYDSWLTALNGQLAALDYPVTVTYWHEPRGDFSQISLFHEGSQQFLDHITASNVAVGPILNGWLLDNRVSEFASYTTPSLLKQWDFVAVDSYQSGDVQNPGPLMPARAIPLLETWMDDQGYPNKPLGVGEYNGFSAAAIAEAGDTILTTPEVWFGLVWNSQGGTYAPLEGDGSPHSREPSPTAARLTTAE